MSGNLLACVAVVALLISYATTRVIQGRLRPPRRRRGSE